MADVKAKAYAQVRRGPRATVRTFRERSESLAGFPARPSNLCHVLYG